MYPIKAKAGVPMNDAAFRLYPSQGRPLPPGVVAVQGKDHGNGTKEEKIVVNI
jgi:hypothetical protein